MTEETHNAAVAGSVGIIMAIGVSAVLGLFLLLGLLFSIQDLDATVNSSTGQPVAQIFLDTVGEKGAIVLMVRAFFSARRLDSNAHANAHANGNGGADGGRGGRRQVIVIGAMFFCGTFSITSNSRMMYAFSRDGAIPGHRFFHKVDEKTKSPIRTGMSPPHPPPHPKGPFVPIGLEADSNTLHDTLQSGWRARSALFWASQV